MNGNDYLRRWYFRQQLKEGLCNMAIFFATLSVLVVFVVFIAVTALRFMGVL